MLRAELAQLFTAGITISCGAGAYSGRGKGSLSGSWKENLWRKQLLPSCWWQLRKRRGRSACDWHHYQAEGTGDAQI